MPEFMAQQCSKLGFVFKGKQDSSGCGDTTPGEGIGIYVCSVHAPERKRHMGTMGQGG